MHCPRLIARVLRRIPPARSGALILLFTAACVQAQLAPRSLIFNTDNLPSGDGATTEPGARRARYIRVNPPVVAAPDSPLRNPAPANFDLDSSRIDLNLFDDIIVTAALEKTIYRNGTNFLATGVIDGWAESQIILVASGDTIAATVAVPGLGVYQIRYAGDGLHKVVELDLARVPPCGPLKRAPANPRPIRARRNVARPVLGTEPGPFVAVSNTVPVAARPDLLAGDLFPGVEGDAITNTVIDVMVVYTTAARIGAGSTAAIDAAVDLAIAEANAAYQNSLIPVVLNLVFRGEVTYTETGNPGTDLGRLQNPADGYMDGVHSLRNQYGADVVCLFTETMNTYAGLGYLMANVSTNFSSYSFSVVRRVYATGNYTFAHEVGHNMGCAHDRQNSASGGAFPYSYGHRFTGNDSNVYRDIMAYAPGTRIPNFSNPNVSYLGTPTGIAAGASNAADNATSISNTMATVAAFRTPVVIFSFGSTSNSLVETNASVTVNVLRTTVTNVSATVDYTTLDATALAGLDYIATNGTLSYAAGETNKSITVALLDDALRENTETFTLRLGNPIPGTLFLSNSTVYVTDDDSSYVGFASATLSVAEDTNTFTVSVFRTGVTNTAVTMNYYATNGTAQAGLDFVATNGMLSFAAGETQKNVSVTVLNDLLAENNETFTIKLVSPVNTAAAGITNLVVTITTNDSSIVAFSAASNIVVEVDGTNTTNVTISVVRTGTTFNACTVDFTTSNVTAVAGSDYTATNGTLSFAAGETNKSITIEIAGDDLLESTETLRVVLRNPSDTRVTLGTNTIYITDNDATSIGFTATTNSVSETNASITLNLARTGATNTAASVTYFTTNATASAGSDYTAASGTLMFPAGQTTNAVTINLADDSMNEGNETFYVRLVNATNTLIGAATNSVTILDDDASVVGFTVTTLSVAENTNSVALTVVRTGATNTAISVNFQTTNGTAVSGSDYVATNGVLSFAAGVTTNTFSVTILDDTLAEDSQSFSIRLLNATNTSLGTSNLVLTINTNDSALIAFSAATSSFTETNSTNNTLTLTVNRTGTTNNACTVAFATTNGTALAASDYLATNGTLTFAAGMTSTQIVIAISNDDLQETNETFRVVLSNPMDCTLTIATNTVTLADDDDSTIGFVTNAVTVAEAGTNVLFIVLRSGATNTAAAVNYTTTNGGAVASADFTATSGTLYFAPGVVSNSFLVDILDDMSQETNETFRVRLASVTNATLSFATNVVTITDDDMASVLFAVSAVSVEEDTNSVTVAVYRTGATNTVVSARFLTTNGTAAAGSDYFATNGILSFGLGETSKSFTVRIINDGLAETNETINLRLANPTNTSLGTSNLVITITTNDSAIIAFASATTSFTETNSTNNTITLTINRTGTTNNLATASFTTTNVSALGGSDYMATNGTLTFAPGVSSTQIVVAVFNDDLQESNEVFRVVLGSPADAQIGIGTNLVTVTDDDTSTVGLTTNAVTVAEAGTNVTFTIVRSGATNTAIAVNFATTNVTAGASDYAVTNGTLYFAPTVTSNSITLAIVDDALQEVNETFRFVLSGVTNATLAVGTNIVTITDDDAAVVALATNAISVAENTNAVTITAYRTGMTNTAVTVAFATLNGTALAASDYFATNGVLSFGLGETSKTFAVRVIDDLLAEGNETINVRLSNPTNTSLGTSNLVLTITTNDSSVIAFASATTSFAETNSTNNTITLTVNRTGTTNNLATVNFTTTNVSALAGSDYTATNGTLTFAAGVTSTQIVVTVSNDDLQETNETFRVILSGPSDATLGIGTNVVTVTDDDVGTIGLTTNLVTVAETGTNVTFTILRAGATNTAVAVNFTTTNVTATGGTDYTVTNGTLYFAPTVTSNSITLAIADDALQEVDETFRLVLSGATNATLLVGTNTVTITDDDASAVALATNAISVAENTNAVTITAYRTGMTNTVVTVAFATLNGTALAASDYFATNGVLSFGLGETSKTFAVRVIDDLLAEGNETINVRLSNPTNTSLGTSNLVLTITTNDSSVIAFASATTSFAETNSTNNTITLTVNRTGTTNNLATVSFTTTNVSALAGSDYTGTNGTLTFAAGVTSTQIVVTVSNDDLQETNETFRVILSSPSDATLGIGTNVVTVTDDDVGTIGLTTNLVTVAETGTNVTFTILRVGATNTAVAVNFTTTNVTATGGTDYTVTNGTLYFAPTVTSNSITLAVADDALQEVDETFRLVLSGVTNATLLVGTNTVTITDDDASAVALATNAISVAEDTNAVTVTVYRTGMTNTAVTVRFSTVDGTATAGSDYFATNGILSFGLGETSKTFAVRVINDGLAENNETINVRLSNPTNTSLGTSNLVLTITTNDSAIVALASATTSFTETNSTNNTITLTVNRTGTTNNLATVSFTTTNVSALAGSDYTGTNGTLTFAAGVTSTQIVVTVSNDDLQETNKTFRVVLSSPSDATLGIGTNVVTLIDDDVSTLSLETNAITVAESGTNVTFIVLRTGATNTAIAVDFRSTNGIAVSGSDYTATNGTLYFAPTVVSNSFKIDITDDLLLEGIEQFSVRLSNATNTTLASGTNTVTITDDDVAGVGFAVTSLSVTEDTNSVTVAVVRTGVTNTTCTVRIITTNGTAVGGSDFIATNAVLSFAPGIVTNLFAVTILNDGIAEGNEVFNLRLVNPTNISLGMSNLVLTITTNDSSVIAFASATTSFAETNSTNNTITLTVNRTGTTNNLATVSFTTTNVSALAGSDYTATNGTLTFAAGVTSTQIVVTVSNDDLQETNETFRVILSSPSDATLGIGTNVVTVTDDDVGTIGLTTNLVTVAETGTNVTFTILRVGATNTAVAVNFTTTNVTATGGTDYTATNGTLYFAPTVTSNSITLAVADDALQEVDETFRLVLSGATNATLLVGTNTATITDDDASTLALATNAISVSEDTNSVSLTVYRTGTTNTAVTVNFSTLNGTALVDSDYYATNGLLSFGLGETSKTFTVRVIDDGISEGNETLSVRLSNPTNTSLGISNLVLTITTNDSAILAFAGATTSFTETNSTNNTITLTINRTGTTNNLATVHFTTTNVSALAGSDYTATNGTLTFAAGVVSTQIVVTVLNDELQEIDKTFRVVLSSPVDATLGIGTNVVTLIDDDVSTVGLTTNVVTVAETGTNVTFTIVRLGATNTAVAMDFTTTNVSATAGTDYTGTNGTLYFAPTVTSNSITLAIADDASQEVNETFRLVLSGLTNSTLLIGTNTATITDDDGSALTFWTNAISVFENTNVITISVLRTGATNTTVSVNFTDLASSSATAGSDFMATNGTLTFAATVTSNSFTVNVVDDGIAENNETANFRLQNPTNTSLGTSNLVITITTNDSSVIAFASATTSFTETNDTNATITLTVNRTGTTNNLATVAFTTTNVTALAGSDYTATNGTLTFAAGVTSTQIVVSIANDNLQESAETFRIVLSSPTDATILTGTNIVTITDDDISTVGFDTNVVSVAEAGTNVSFSIYRTGATNTAVAVDIDTVNVTATGGADYAVTNDTLYFAPGQTSNSITLAIAQDLLYEANETFRLVLSGVTNSSTGTGTNTATIIDDDFAALTFTVSSDEVSELDSTIDITVHRTGVTNTTVSVAYFTTNDTATAGTDYTATNGVLTFAPTETNKTITVAILFDAAVESPEVFTLRLVNLTNAAAGTNLTLDITINDAFGGAPGRFQPAAAAPVSISAIKLPESDHLRVRVTGPNGTPFLIEATTDFQAWKPVITNVISGDGAYDWFTPIDPAVTARYFRVVRPK